MTTSRIPTVLNMREGVIREGLVLNRELASVRFRPARMSKLTMAPAAALGIVLVLALLAACSPAAVTSLLPVANGPLVTITTRGGECPDGPCGAETKIERDGRVHTTVPTAAELGTVPADVLTELDAAIKLTDFDVVRARPFTGECPVNFDGQESIFEFGAPGRVERIASCETEIDQAHPVFAAVDAALAAVGAR